MACGQQTVKMTISITRLPNEKYGAISSSLNSIFISRKLFLLRSLRRNLSTTIFVNMKIKMGKRLIHMISCCHIYPAMFIQL